MRYKDALRFSKKCPSCCSIYKYERFYFNKAKDVEKENNDEDEEIEKIEDRKQNKANCEKYPWE